MAAFKKVALLGKGLLGSAVLGELVKRDFDVTVFSRSPPSGETISSGVTVKQVDYASEESLVAGLRGHDVAISTLGPQATLSQITIIDACILAGVKRYVPSDFGSSTTDPEARGFPVYGPLARIQDYLREKAQSGELEYTLFSIGMFLEFVINTPAIVDPDTHTAQIYDKGDVPFSTTSVASIGKAVAGALKNPDATRNKNLFIHDILITQAKVLAFAKEASPPGTEWTETPIDAKAELDRALKQSIENPMDIQTLMPLLKAALLTGVYNSGYKKVDNELVGLPLMTDEEMKKLFSLRYQGKG